MGSRRRFAISWRRMEPARRGRFLAWLIPIGIVHGGLAVAATRLVYGEDVGFSADDYALVLVTLVLAAWGTGWVLRGRIAATAERDLLRVGFRAMLVGAYLSGSLLVMLGGVAVFAMGDWIGIWMVLFCWVAGVMPVLIGVQLLFPSIVASLFLTWFAVRLLHRAAGGAVEAHLPARDLWPG